MVSERVLRSVTLAVCTTAALALAAPPAAAQPCPELVGRWPYGTPRALAVSGTTAYLGSGTALPSSTCPTRHTRPGAAT